jgi:transmembrane sensor
MTEHELKVLYDKCTSGKCTPEEQRLFEEYHDNFDLSDIPWTAEMGDSDAIKKHITDQLHKSLHKSHKRKLASAFAMVLCVILAFSIGIYTIGNGPTGNAGASNNRNAKNVIVPGSNKAILTLAGGKKVVLDNLKSGSFLNQNDISIQKSNDGRIVYSGTNMQTNGVSAINVMTTPRGGQYQLVLSDGTVVYLNAETSVKFPVVFNGSERIVELSGEAYFEVAHDSKRPFKVLCKGQQIKVLGTHFNVNAYDDDQVIKTTLLQGSVKLNSGGKQVMLTPGEQASLLTDRSFVINKVNAEDAISWKKGYFLFRNENIKSIMKQVSRWYDVDIDYRNGTENIKLGGTVSRFEQIDDLLKTIQLTESVHFKIEGRRVIVMP